MPRLVLLFVIVWAFTGPIDRVPLMVGAAGLAPAAVPADSTLRASPVFQETGFAVADGPIGGYFAARGGARTFGPPLSNEFRLLGLRTQIFRDHVLKVEASGAVSTVNLFALGAIPFRNVGGRIIPEIDQALLASSPVPGTPDYAARVEAFIKANAPDQWESMPVGFYQAFLGTVKYEEALPNGGERALLPGFSHEIWGLPVSRPIRDAQNPDVVLLRWERGVMAWSRQSGSVTTVPLGETFKQVLTGEGLGPERTAAAAGSQFLLQLKPASPGGVARPSDLPNTVLATAFTKGNTAVNAAQLSDPYVGEATATPTPTTSPLPANPPPPPPPPAVTITPTLPGAIGAAPPPPPGAAAGALPASSPSAGDPCYRDEQITFSPAEPRVNNEMLIAVTSSRPHPYGRLAGTEKTTFVRERPGQLGIVWEWTIALSYPGKHEYTFYTDSTVPCKKIEVTVRQALTTRTPTPTKTATPYGWDNGNSNNSNSNNNNSNNSNDNNSNVTTAPPWNPYNYIVAGVDQYNCETFQSQAQAQSVLRADPTDPNQLDTDFDGVACESYNSYAYPNEDDELTVTRVVATNTPVVTPTPVWTATPTATLTRAQRTPGVACWDFPSGQASQDFLRANPSDPLYMDYTRDGWACNNNDAPGMPGGLWMNPPLTDRKTPAVPIP